jgi:hypothetical protein
LRYEERLAKNSGSEIEMKESGNQITLAIKAKSIVGENEPFRDSDILTSDNKRTYVFDKETKLLQSFQMQVLHDNKYITLLEATSILYNTDVDENSILMLPENIEWVDLNAKIENELLENVSAKQAATVILKSVSEKNIEPVKEAFRGYDVKVLAQYFGLQILEIGDSFTSEISVVEFIPCKVKLPNGEIKKFNLALRNDNANKIWVISGGF